MHVHASPPMVDATWSQKPVHGRFLSTSSVGTHTCRDAVSVDAIMPACVGSTCPSLGEFGAMWNARQLCVTAGQRLPLVYRLLYQTDARWRSGQQSSVAVRRRDVVDIIPTVRYYESHKFIDVVLNSSIGHCPNIFIRFIQFWSIYLNICMNCITFTSKTPQIKATGNSPSEFPGISGNRGPPKFPARIPGNFEEQWVYF